MDRDIVISVKNISKTYRLYHSKRDFIMELIHPFRKKFHQDYLALKEISFSVKKGEVIGIIGGNGSGKSTLLKILASVVTPTKGEFECKGNVAALLELGGGFNKELTGVQNIQFLAALKGYSKNEIKRITHEVIDFSEIGSYAYQPVKKYSSGMFMRLAFSLSVVINPDILILDEILSVGDMAFNKKSFNKIQEFKNANKTILLCSHSLNTIKNFCSRVIWINKGNIQDDGDPETVTDNYASYMNSK